MERKVKMGIAAGVILAVVVVVVVVTLATLLSPRTSQFRATFRKKCQAFPETSERCEQILQMFEEVYVGKDPCNFPEEAYQPLFVKNPFTHACEKTMFWSDTKDLVHRFCKERNHFVPMKNTLLGNILDDLKWCGRKSSKDTFICLCEKCDINTVSSFWKRASAEFAEYACGRATVMLNGAIKKPFDPTSADCSHESLQDLRNVLDPKITLHCHSVTESDILKCVETGTTTDACWT